MRYPYTSNFPNQIDEEIFFCDVSLESKPIMDTYEKLINQGNYSEANIFISQHNNIHQYCADLFNYMESKIKTTQEYVSEKEKINPIHDCDDIDSFIENEFYIG